MYLRDREISVSPKTVCCEHLRLPMQLCNHTTVPDKTSSVSINMISFLVSYLVLSSLRSLVVE